MTLTSLQLAERIAAAVLIAHANAPGELPAPAVMDTLREYGCWFCRLEETGGATTFTTLPHEIEPELPFE